MDFTHFHSRACRLALAAFAVVAVAFGGPASGLAHEDEAMEAMPGMSGGATAFGHPGTADQVSRDVVITMGDMSFSPSAVRVKLGETIRFVIRNPSAIDHEFTLGDAATQAAHRQEMAEAAEKGMPMHHHHGGNAVMVAAGQTQALIWHFDVAGSVDYDCNVPGHFESGMLGIVTVAP
jgi:uncharacterized cupredoxin-like copper-binding protein